jgi:hypothetical protein
LQPGGVMHIALYSAIARRDLNETRAMVLSPAADASPRTIRALRRTIMNFPLDDPRRSVIGFTDFFSTSECRDLLFHVEEHQFGIPDIASFLEAQGFDFIGFETRARDAYLRRFPDDIAATRLDNWHLFELENPATFFRHVSVLGSEADVTKHAGRPVEDMKKGPALSLRPFISPGASHETIAGL